MEKCYILFLKNSEYVAYSWQREKFLRTVYSGTWATSSIQLHQIPSIIQNLHSRDLCDLRISTGSIRKGNACRKDIWEQGYTQAQGFQEENLIKDISLRYVACVTRSSSTVSRYLAPPRQEYKPLSSRGEREETRTLIQVPVLFSTMALLFYESNYTCRRIHNTRTHDLPWLRFCSFVGRSHSAISL